MNGLLAALSRPHPMAALNAFMDCFRAYNQLDILALSGPQPVYCITKRSWELRSRRLDIYDTPAWTLPFSLIPCIRF